LNLLPGLDAKVSEKNQHPQSDVLVDFLSELASHLLSCGVAITEFRSAAQAAFVQAALRNARLQNLRVNQSAIAAVTGLSRAQVRSLLRVNAEPAAAVQSRLSAITAGWRTDPTFTDEDGKPRPLSLTNGRNGFLGLTRKYAGDVSHRALLTELTRLRCVRQEGKSVLLCAPEISSRQQELTRMLSQGLTHIIRKPPQGASEIVHVITGEATYDAPEATSRMLLKRRLVQGTKAFAADIQAAGDAIASRRRKRTDMRKLSTRVLLVTVE
jgi:Family of unknown function (DUF6502)